MKENQPLTFKNLFLPFTTKKAIVFIIIIGALVFGNGLFNGFVGDDKPLISENPVAQNLQNLPKFFTSSDFYGGNASKLEGFSYRPLQTTTFSVLYSLFGPNPFAFHFFLLIFYIANACLLFLFLKQFFQKILALTLSIVFLLHPINSETAFYISSMEEVLYFSFGILALFVLSKFQSIKSIVAVSILLFLSLLAKESGVLFLLTSLVYVFIYKRRIFYRLLIYLVPVLVFYTILRIYAVGLISESTVLAPILNLNLPERLINIPAIIFFYLKTFIFPLDLAMSYHWVVTKINLQSFFLPLVFDLVFFGALFIFTVNIFKNFPRKLFLLSLFFILWFLSGISLYLQIIPLDLTVSERWFYFPIVGLIGLIGITINYLKINLNNKIFIVIAVLILLLLSIRTIVRSFDWKNNTILAMHDLKVSKEAYNLELILSGEYYNQKKYEKAVIHAQNSIRLYPNSVNYNVLGLAYYNLGSYQKAKESFLKSLQFGEFDATYVNLAVIALLYGNPKENITFIKNVALKKYPENPELWANLAWLEYDYGDTSQAKIEIQRAYKLAQSEQIFLIYNAIMHDLPLQIKNKDNQ